MVGNGHDTVTCEICGKEKPRSEVFPAELIQGNKSEEVGQRFKW